MYGVGEILHATPLYSASSGAQGAHVASAAQGIICISILCVRDQKKMAVHVHAIIYTVH